MGTSRAAIDGSDGSALDHGRQTFATGQLLRIALDGTSALFVNAGHPWPLGLRNGTVGELRPAVNLPFGFTAHQAPYQVQDPDLRLCDRLVLYTSTAVSMSSRLVQ